MTEHTPETVTSQPVARYSKPVDADVMQLVADAKAAIDEMRNAEEAKAAAEDRRNAAFIGLYQAGWRPGEISRALANGAGQPEGTSPSNVRVTLRIAGVIK
jgi:hypothetical protein